MIGTLRVLLLSLALAPSAAAQTQEPQRPAGQEEEVVRVNTDLVQTDVAVVDKQGRFVDGLRPEQFELRVAGRPKPISFFERVKAGSPEEERQLSARLGGRAQQAGGSAPPTPRGGVRLIFFFVDDVHLAPENLARTRRALLRFVDDGMGQDDQVAVVSASGQVGFLQQLTNNRAVLREAVGRLGYKRNPAVNADSVTISEYDANQIEARNRQLFSYLMSALRRLGSTNPAGTVINRARQVSATARFDTAVTLNALEDLMLSSAPLPGRKIVFFLSDGFVLDVRRNGALDLLERVTATAARVGAVVYTMDARGTFYNPATDASTNPYPDFTGNVSRNLLAEASATQEPLRILAEDTGGRAIINSNSFDDGFRRALSESSDYYLLAWRPESEELSGDSARLKVSIKDRPDLKVRVRRGHIEPPVATTARKARAGKPAAATSPETELLSALGSVYPVRALPVALSVGYTGAPDTGAVLTASMQIEAADLAEATVPGEDGKVEFDVLGVALNDRGSISSFTQKLSAPATEAGRGPIVWNQQLPLAPGLYQVRVAVRDRRSGRAGSAMQWIEIPRITPENLSMSSIFLGELKAEGTATPQQVPVSVDRRFRRGARLRYQTYFYHARGRAGAAGITVKVQVFHNDRPVAATSQAQLAASGAADATRLPFSGEIALGQLPAGRYVLQISASGQEPERGISQQTDFNIE